MNVPYATAYHALFNRGHGVAGETVLVHGASGGVGIGAVQLARARGLTVIGTAGTERGRQLVLEQGAHHALDHSAPGYLDELGELTGGKGPDVILEMLANANLQKDLDVVAMRGRIVVIGNRGTTEINARVGDEQGRRDPRHGALPRHAGAARRHPRRPRGGAPQRHAAPGRRPGVPARPGAARPRGGDGGGPPRQGRPRPVAGGQKRPICFAGALGRTLNVARSRSPGCPYSLASPPAAARPARVRLACDLRAPPRRLDLFEPPASPKQPASFTPRMETGDTNVNDIRRISRRAVAGRHPLQGRPAPDPERFVRQCRWLLSQNVGLAVFGTNSEANSLSVDERIELLDRLVGAGIDPARMMPGTGCCALTDSVRLTAHAVKLGCAGVLMLPPFYYKGVSDDGLFRSFAEVIERVGEARLRVYLYHIPPVAQVPITLGLVERLLKAYPTQTAGMKDSSGDWSNTKAFLDAFAGAGFDVFAGLRDVPAPEHAQRRRRLHQRHGQRPSRPDRAALRHLAGRRRRRAAGASRRDPRRLPEVPDDPRPEGGHRALRPRRGVGDRAPAARRPDAGAGEGAGRRAGPAEVHDAGTRAMSAIAKPTIATRAAPTGRHLVRTMCPMNCHPTLCGMLVEVEDGRLLRVRGDPENPDSQGFLCVRGQASREIIGNSARLLHPLMRSPRSGALASGDVGRGARPHRRADASGRPRGGGRLVRARRLRHQLRHADHSHLVRRFANLHGCQWWNPTMICWGLGAFGLGLTGVLETNTKEDMGQHANFVLLWGANLASQPNTARHLAAARHRGAHVVTIDVRETEATAQSDESLIIRPGTDAALALGLMHVIVRRGAARSRASSPAHPRLRRAGRPREGLHAGLGGRRHGRPRRAHRGAGARYAATRPAMIVLGGSSMHKGPNGWQAARAIGCLPALTGNLGMAGGGFGPRHGSSTHGQALASIVAQERRPPGRYIPNQMSSIIDALGDGRVRVLLLFGTDMVSSFADAGRVAEGLSRQDLVVSYELFMNDTARRVRRRRAAGHLVAGGDGVQEHQHAPLPDAARSSSRPARRAPARGCSESWRAASTSRTSTRGPPAEGVLDALLDHPSTGHATVDALRAEGGMRALKISHVAYPDRAFDTPSGKVEFVSERARALGLPALPAWEAPSASPYPLTFQQGRTLAHFHSFFDHGRALPSLAKAEAEPKLWISPTDAAARSLADGAPIRIYNERGEFGARAHVTAQDSARDRVDARRLGGYQPADVGPRGAARRGRRSLPLLGRAVRLRRPGGGGAGVAHSSEEGPRPTRMASGSPGGGGWCERDQAGPGVMALAGTAGPLVLTAALYWFLVRPRFLRWGATESEVARAWPGDELVGATAEPAPCAR